MLLWKSLTHQHQINKCGLFTYKMATPSALEFQGRFAYLRENLRQISDHIRSKLSDEL